VQFTDTHLHADAVSAMRGTNTLETLRRTLSAARETIAAADAILHTGDAVHDEAGGYLWLQRELGSFDKPVLCVPGNHDDPLAMRELLPAPFEHGGHRDFGRWRLVMLDSQLIGETGGALAPAELARLDAVLADAQSDTPGTTPQHALVVLHHHPVPMQSAWLDTIGLDNAAEFFAVLERRRARVRGVLWGHVHQEFDAERKGIRLLGTPSTCVQFAPQCDEFALDTRPPAFRTLTLHEDGRIDSRVHWVQ
jgi:Icc protein